MANKRTVDPTASVTLNAIICVEASESQMRDIELLCKQRNVKRSQLLRDLVRQAVVRVVNSTQ